MATSVVVAAIPDRGGAAAIDVVARTPAAATEPTLPTDLTPRKVGMRTAELSQQPPAAPAAAVAPAAVPVPPLAGERIDRVPIALLPDAPPEIKAEASPFRLDMLPALTEDGTSFDPGGGIEALAAPLPRAAYRAPARRVARDNVVATIRLPQP